jgi:hypothetical protein
MGGRVVRNYRYSRLTLQMNMIIRTEGIFIVETSQLMLFREIINIYGGNHRKHKYSVWQNAWFPNVAADGTYSDHWALNG